MIEIKIGDQVYTITSTADYPEPAEAELKRIISESDCPFTVVEYGHKDEPTIVFTGVKLIGDPDFSQDEVEVDIEFQERKEYEHGLIEKRGIDED